MNIFKNLCLLLLCTIPVIAKDIYPTFILSSKGHVLDFVYDNAKLYVANDIGTIEVFDLRKQERVHEIVLPKEKTSRDELITPKIISIDKYKNHLLFVTTTAKAYREVWLYDGAKLKKLISTDKKMTIKQANFIDEKNILLATLGHEVTLYNQTDNYKSYTKHIENSTFSHLQLSSDKKHVLSGSESGRVSLTDVQTGKILKIYESLNVDNINKISYANNTLITAGQDRRVAVYMPQKEYYIQNDFIVYSTAINPTATLGVYSSNEQNHLQLFNIQTGEKLHTLIGHYAIPNNIKFINEKEFFSTGYENNIFYWNLNLID